VKKEGEARGPARGRTTLMRISQTKVLVKEEIVGRGADKAHLLET